MAQKENQETAEEKDLKKAGDNYKKKRGREEGKGRERKKKAEKKKVGSGHTFTEHLNGQLKAKAGNWKSRAT